jgi:hypothetical protein
MDTSRGRYTSNNQEDSTMGSRLVIVETAEINGHTLALVNVHTTSGSQPKRWGITVDDGPAASCGGHFMAEDRAREAFAVEAELLRAE